MTELDLTAAIHAGANELFGFNTTAGLHFVIRSTSSGDGYEEIARVVVEAAAALIEKAVLERLAETAMSDVGGDHPFNAALKARTKRVREKVAQEIEAATVCLPQAGAVLTAAAIEATTKAQFAAIARGESGAGV